MLTLILPEIKPSNAVDTLSFPGRQIQPNLQILHVYISKHQSADPDVATLLFSCLCVKIPLHQISALLHENCELTRLE